MIIIQGQHESSPIPIQKVHDQNHPKMVEQTSSIHSSYLFPDKNGV